MAHNPTGMMCGSAWMGFAVKFIVILSAIAQIKTGEYLLSLCLPYFKGKDAWRVYFCPNYTHTYFCNKSRSI